MSEKTYRDKVRDKYISAFSRREMIEKMADTLNAIIKEGYKQRDWEGDTSRKVDVYGPDTVVINQIYKSANSDTTYSHEVAFVYHIDRSLDEDARNCRYYKDKYIDKEYMVFKLTDVNEKRKINISKLVCKTLMDCTSLFLSTIEEPIMDNLEYTLNWIDKHFEDEYNKGRIQQVISQTNNIISCLVFDPAQNTGVVYNMKPSLYPNITQHIEYNNIMESLRAICELPG